MENILVKATDNLVSLTIKDVTINNLTVDEIKELEKAISSALEGLNPNFGTELVWNPRSKRHERVKTNPRQ